MKKLLSILSAIGLVATASTSVVSCTKTSELPTYHDVSDIKEWSFLSHDDILSSDDFNGDGTVKNKLNILGTIAKKFKNPAALKEQFNGKEADLEINPVAGTKITTSNGFIKEQFVIHRITNNSDGTKVVRATSMPVTLMYGSVEYLKDQKLTINLDMSSDESTLVSPLRGIYNDMASSLNVNNASDVNNYTEIAKKSAAMMSFTSSLFNLPYEINSQKPSAIDDSGDTAPTLDLVAGFDKQNVRYDSINQQIVMGYDEDASKTEQLNNGIDKWKKAMETFNEKVLKSFVENIKDSAKKDNVNYEFFAGVVKEAIDVLKSNKVVQFTVTPSIKNSKEAN